MSSALLSLASDPRLVFAGWTLLVTLWATSAVGILLAVWRAWWPGASAGAQHTAAVVAFGLALTLAAGTPFALLAVPASAEPVGGRPVIEPVPHLADPRASSAPAQSVATPASANNGLRLEVFAGAAAILWMVGVVLLGLRLAGGLLVAHSIRRRSHPLADEAALAVAAALQKSLDVPGQVLLLESSELESPAVIGWRTPALILPVDVSGQLTAEMTSGLIAHELAHIRRRDYVVNVIQSVVETILFFSPAVLWISQRIRETREYCCDDTAVGRCDRHLYVTALTTLASLGAVNTARRSMGAAGPRLITRARRLLKGDLMPARSSVRLMVFASALVLLMISGLRAPLASALRATRSAAEARGPAAAGGLAQDAIPYGFSSEQEGSGVVFQVLESSRETPLGRVRFGTIRRRRSPASASSPAWSAGDPVCYEYGCRSGSSCPT